VGLVKSGSWQLLASGADRAVCADHADRAMLIERCQVAGEQGAAGRVGRPLPRHPTMNSQAWHGSAARPRLRKSKPWPLRPSFCRVVGLVVICPDLKGRRAGSAAAAEECWFLWVGGALQVLPGAACLRGAYFCSNFKRKEDRMFCLCVRAVAAGPAACLLPCSTQSCGPAACCTEGWRGQQGHGRGGVMADMPARRACQRC
jgi:hypothetical protein